LFLHGLSPYRSFAIKSLNGAGAVGFGFGAWNDRPTLSRLEDVVHLAAGQDEANRIAKRIHAGTDLRAQAAARTELVPEFWTQR
jgi:hypothetical protein